MEKRGNSGGREAEGTGDIIVGLLESMENAQTGKREKRRKTDQQDWVMLQRTSLVAARRRLLMLFFSAGGEAKPRAEGSARACIHGYGEFETTILF